MEDTVPSSIHFVIAPGAGITVSVLHCTMSMVSGLRLGNVSKCRLLFTRRFQSMSAAFGSPASCGRSISSNEHTAPVLRTGLRPTLPKSLSGAPGPSWAPLIVHCDCTDPGTSDLPAVGDIRWLPIQVSANALFWSHRFPLGFSHSTDCTRQQELVSPVCSLP